MGERKLKVGKKEEGEIWEAGGFKIVVISTWCQIAKIKLRDDVGEEFGWEKLRRMREGARKRKEDKEERMN